MPLDVGDRAPAFALPDPQGNVVRLADFRGKRLLVTFYAEDFTPACTDQACAFRDLAKDLAAHGVAVVAVSPDPPERHAEFAKEHRIRFALLSDPTHRMMEAWGAWGEKTLYGRKVRGVIRSTYVVGPDGRIDLAFRNLRVKGHAARVLAALDAARPA